MSVTVTPPLREAREALRRRGITATVGDLALAGALQMLAAAEQDERDEEHRLALRRRLVQRVRAGDAFDAEALREVRESGWTRA